MGVGGGVGVGGRYVVHVPITCVCVACVSVNVFVRVSCVYLLLPSCKARQVIALCYCIAFVYISVPVNPRRLDCTISSCMVFIGT